MKHTKLAATILLLSSIAASATPVCLTKREARQLWPKQHLYWYGPNHCWSDRRGKPRNLRYDLIRENHAQVTAVPEPKPVQVAEATVTETKENLDTWPPTVVKPIRIIEVIRPSAPVPVTPVEVVTDIPPLPPAPPDRLGLIASFGGAFSAIAFAFIMFNRRTRNHVKRSAYWIYQGIGLARSKVLSLGALKRNQQPPVHKINIGYFLRRADRAGHDAHLAKVLDRLANDGPCDEWHEPDHSALACWARSIRAAQDPRG